MRFINRNLPFVDLDQEGGSRFGPAAQAETLTFVSRTGPRAAHTAAA
jgi:hypothetical protein